jgi:hypothetical protein
MAATHADYATGITTMLHATPRGYITSPRPLPSPETITSGNLLSDWILPATYVPGWLFACVFLVMLGTFLSSQIMACFCGEQRRKALIASCAKPRVWYGIALATFACVVGAVIAYAVLVDRDVTDGGGTLDIGRDVQAHLDHVVTTVQGLSVEADDAAAHAVFLRDNGASDNNATIQETLNTLADVLTTASAAASDANTQINRGWSVTSYLDDGDWYLGKVRYYASLYWVYVCLWVLSIVAIGLARVFRPSAATQKAQCMREACYGWSGAVVFFLYFSTVAVPLWVLGLGSLMFAEVTSDICVAPYQYVNSFVTTSNSTSNDDVIQFYVHCTNSSAGPVNPNFDMVETRILDVTAYAQLVNNYVLAHNYTNSTASEVTSFRTRGNVLVVALVSVLDLVGILRGLASCLRVHEFSERLLRQLCVELVPNLFGMSLAAISLLLVFPAFYFTVVAPFRDTDTTWAQTGHTLLATTPPPPSRGSDM